MRELKKIFRSKPVLTLGGRLIALWLRLVHATTRMVNNPDDGYARVEGHYPAIVALWHGQHFMVPLVKRKGDPFKALVSRSGDGHLNSVAAEALGVDVVRGSGGRNRSKTLTKGGISALKNLVSCLREGTGVVMTVNVPKTGARECGLGVVTLAKLSGRPIIPAAYASSRRIDLDTWDKASVNLPFGKAAFIIGEPIYVSREADEEELEHMRQTVEAALNETTRKAYETLKR
nr:lysophospholipid acyltransferase family protein [uncultured Cohaesibacter sp.]